jgi:hypothetical protein
VLRGNAALLHEVLPGGVGIPVSAFFCWLAGTLPVAAVVKNQHGQAELMKQPDRVQPVGVVAGIAVAEQQRAACRIGRNKPGVQLLVVTGGEPISPGLAWSCRVGMSGK